LFPSPLWHLREADNSQPTWIRTRRPDRASRFLALTGLTPDELRASLGYPSTLNAVLEYLCGHEPDLIAAAEAIGCTPQDLVAARERLSR
jgi:Protein of unknown function (DUF3572)